jgi:hypothetical protein
VDDASGIPGFHPSGRGGALFGECPRVDGAQKAAEAAWIQIAVQTAWREYDAKNKGATGQGFMPPVSIPETAPSAADALILDGTGAFDALMRTWLMNFEGPVWKEGDVDEHGKVVTDLALTNADGSPNPDAKSVLAVGAPKTPQPDRRNAIMGVFAAYDRAASAYIKSRGGLAGACIDSIVRQALVPPEQAVALGKRIAMNMVNIASTASIPLDRLLEKSLLMNIDTDPNAPPTGPIALDVIDFDRNQPTPGA